LGDYVDVYNEYVDEYQDYTLDLSERKILSVLKDKWHNTKMLDIGVGAGRTSYTFAPIVKDYTGIDYSYKMIEKCKMIIGESDSVRFDFQDATDLSRYKDERFDFVLFSMNGICSVGHDDRVKILAEVHKVMDDDGLFFFSTQSLHTFPDHFPFKIVLPEFDKRKPFHWAYKWAKLFSRKYKVNKMYRRANINEICDMPWSILVTGDHDFKMGIYHSKPDYQVKQLEDAGFNVMTVYDEKGNERDPLKDRIHGYMYYLCKKRKN